MNIHYGRKKSRASLAQFLFPLFLISITALFGSSVFAATTITTIDSEGDVGFDPSLVLSNNDKPIISYLDKTNSSLKVAVCSDTACTTNNTLTSVTVGNVDWYSSIKLNAQGYPVISYLDKTSNNLKLAVCGNITCTANNSFTSINGQGEGGTYSSLVLNSKDYPVISYIGADSQLHLAICGDATCATNTLVNLGEPIGWYLSLTLGSNNEPVISYYSGNNLKLAKCGDNICSTKVISTVDNSADVGDSSTIVLNQWGNPVISYFDKTNTNLKLAICGDPSCSSSNTLIVDDAGGAGPGGAGGFTSLVLNSQGNPVISYFDIANGDLKLAVCGNADCTGGNKLTTVDSTGEVGRYSSLALNSQGNPVIGYYDTTNQDLKLAVCDNPTCSPSPEIDLQGNNISIPNGATTPNVTDNTDFGSVNIGDTLTNTFTISNTGVKTLNLKNVSLSGIGCEPFSMILPTSFNLEPNESITFQVTFAPTSESTFNCTVNIDNNDSDENPYTFALTGKGASTQPIPSPPPVQPLPTTMNLTINFSGTGHGHVTTNPSGIDCDNSNPATCSHSFDTATWINLNATAADDSKFIRWSGNRSDCENAKVFMIDPHACTANFELLRFPLTVTTVGQGKVNSNPAGIDCSQCAYDFDTGTEVMLTAMPGDGWQFKEWEGDCVGTSPEVMVTIDKARTCKANFIEIPSKGTAKWTFMVYLDADNNLEEFGIGDFLEMAQVENSMDVNIVVQFDRTSGYSSNYGDWTSCKRFKVQKGMQPTTAFQVSDIGECNMGDPATLTNFINWATSTYPANRYALVIWNHGGGWRDIRRQEVHKEVAYDDTNGDVLFMKEVKQAFNNAITDANLIGFDACLMAMVEVGYELKDTGASVVVGSEETEPGDGWPYDKILTDLLTHSNWNPNDLGQTIVNRYYESYGNSETQSIVLLNRMNNLATVTNTLADTIRTSWNNNPSTVKNAAQAVIDEIKLAVNHERHGAGWPGSHGLAIYFPLNSPLDTNYNGSQIDFPANTHWEEFLGDFYLKMDGSWIKTARTLSQRYDVPAHIDLYDFAEKLIQQDTDLLACTSPTIKSVSNGDWNNPTTWGVWNGTTWQPGVRTPLNTDSILIQNGHTVRVPSNQIKINSLCNQGNIFGQDGINGSGTSSGESQHATGGGNISLTVENLLFNGKEGQIRAGRGGDGMFLGWPHIPTKGGKGGNIRIRANHDLRNYGMIGPDAMQLSTRNSWKCLPNYPILDLLPTGNVGGNGGTGHHWNEGDAARAGGNGGSTTVIGFNIDNQGRIAAGYGGNAQEHDDCEGISLLQNMPRSTPEEITAFEAKLAELTAKKAGLGGDAVIIPLSGGSVTGMKEIDGGNGSIWIEPTMLISGQEVHIYNSRNITIFGGDNATLTLNGLRNQAIEATETITLAVGKGGIVDLRGNAGKKVLKAGKSVTIFADAEGLWLDEGTTLSDLIDAPIIETYPHKILYHVTLHTPNQVNGVKGETLPVDIIINNGGPTVDTYNLTVADSAGLQLGMLPKPITVEGLDSAELKLDALPLMVEATNTITLTTTSQHDPSVSATTEITVTVRDNTTPSLSADNTRSGTVSDQSGAPIAGAILKVGDKTLTTDKEGHWQFDNSAITSGTLYDAQGNLLAGATIQLGNQTLITDTDGHWELTQPIGTGNDSQNVPDTAYFSSPLPPTPTCYASGLVDWVCNANGQQLTDLTVGHNGIVSYGTLVGTLTNQGWVSNLTLKPQSHLTGGIVTGYLTNQGEMSNFEFRGAALVGGTLAGEITTTSQVGGYFRDVQLAAGTHLRGGQVAGEISGEAQAPALLEDLAIQAGSHLQYVTIGDGVKLAAAVTLGEGVQFNHPSEDPRLVPKQPPQAVACDTQLPSLGVTAINVAGQVIETQCQCAGGVSVNGGSFEPTLKMRLTDTIEIRGTVCVAPEQLGQLADLVVYLDYQPLNATAEEKQHYMLDSSGEVLPWDGDPAHLVAFQQTMLAAGQEVLFYQGQLATTGKLELFFGYRLMDGTLVSNQKALEITITDK